MGQTITTSIPRNARRRLLNNLPRPPLTADGSSSSVVAPAPIPTSTTACVPSPSSHPERADPCGVSGRARRRDVSRLIVPALSTVGVEPPGVGRHLVQRGLHVLDSAPEPEVPAGIRPRLLVRKTP